MTERTVAVYYAWSHPAEAAAPLGVIENRFPTLFELRRMLYPHYRELDDPGHIDQGVGGFLDHIMKKNFTAFVDLAHAETGRLALELERIAEDSRPHPIDVAWLENVDTLIIISFDSLRTGQHPSESEVDALRTFLAKPGNLVAVSLHHDIGHADQLPLAQRLQLQEAQFHHHGDKTLPPEQRFGGFGRALLNALGVPVENQFGLHPAAEPDGSPSPIEVATELDRLRLLNNVTTFNLHPHLPHLERVSNSSGKLDVLARQRLDLTAPPHPFTQNGRTTFDALLQSRPGVFAADLLVSDSTLWSSTAGGVDSLRQLWTNILRRELRP